jgi:hypothetical protein
MRDADYKSTEGLVKSQRSKDFGADVGVGHVGLVPPKL